MAGTDIRPHYSYSDTLAHYLAMAINPGTRDYARRRVQELSEDRSGLWAGLYDDIKRELKKLESTN